MGRLRKSSSRDTLGNLCLPQSKRLLMCDCGQREKPFQSPRDTLALNCPDLVLVSTEVRAQLNTTPPPPLFILSLSLSGRQRSRAAARDGRKLRLNVRLAVTVFIITIILVREVLLRPSAEVTWRGFCAVIRCCGPIGCNVTMTATAIIVLLVLFFFFSNVSNNKVV